MGVTRLRITSELTESDYNYFIQLFEFNISTLYPFSSRKTAESLVNIHKTGFDSNGYFTKRKTLWKLIDELGLTLGFSIATEKRGGSVKFGPTIVVKDYRNRGYGSTFRELLEVVYREKGYRKAYLTTTSFNTAAFSYLIKMGYKIELHLKQHYTTKDDEIILSKFLQDSSVESIPSLPMPPEILVSYGAHVVSYLSNYYDEIDETFYRNLEKSLSKQFVKSEESFIRKNKIKFDFREDNFFAITSPKRGGCIKISPLVLSGRLNDDLRNLGSLVNYFDEKHFHKFYTFVPINNLYDRTLLESFGFKIEGVFREPYKVGCDMFIVSLFRINY